MLKKTIIITAFLCPFIVFGQDILSNSTQNYDEIISNYKQLSLRQLYDTANYSFNQGNYDIALVYYNLITNIPIKDNDIEQQKIIVETLNRMALIYNNFCDYSSAYKFLIRALQICEKINYISYEPKIYNNIGNIYERFKRYDLAKDYYQKAMNYSLDSAGMASMLNNLGVAEMAIGNMDSAFYFFNKALPLSRKKNDRALNSIYNNIASTYFDRMITDSALHYFRLSLEDAKNKNIPEKEALALSNLSELFFEMNNTDSSLYYIDLASTIAKENKFTGILANNYLTLSKIEEAKGQNKKALAYYKTYANLKDSIYNADRFGEINQIQRLYEISKTNQQIEQLVMEQQIKERTIQYQKNIQRIIIAFLLSVFGVSVFIFVQNRKLKISYKVLFEKNIELINLQEKTSGKSKIKVNTQNVSSELMNEILSVMKDPDIFCEASFTVDKLATLVQSNHNYVSQSIKNSLNKNFRSFLNSYRIREAQRILMEPDTKKYSIDFVAEKVGFKSRSGFFDAFKEITGVSPNFYIKSLQE